MAGAFECRHEDEAGASDTSSCGALSRHRGTVACFGVAKQGRNTATHVEQTGARFHPTASRTLAEFVHAAESFSGCGDSHPRTRDTDIRPARSSKMYSSLQAALLFVPLLALVGGSLAGPVQEREVDGRSASTGHASAPVPALSDRSMEQGAAPNLVVAPMTPLTLGGAASAPSTSALAAEIINEAGAGAQTTSEQTRYGKASAKGLAIAPGPTVSGATRPSDDEWGLREMGKAAVSWIKEIAPWLRSDADQDSTGHSVTPDGADWSTSSLDGHALDRNARGNTTRLPDTLRDVSLDSTATVGTGKSLASTGLEPQQNLVSTVYSFVSEVLAHPMTWLVVGLFVIGAAVAKRFDRRPTK